jgi:DNA polymerase-2
MVFKGLETVRTDWTPLAQQFQQELYLRIFRNQPYQDYVRETIAKLMSGELDDRWSTASACAARWPSISATCRRTCAPPGWPMSKTSGWAAAAVSAARHHQIRLDHQRPGAGGLSAVAARLRALFDKALQPVAEGILPFVDDDFATIVTGQLGLF